jgi:hypothetical protein
MGKDGQRSWLLQSKTKDYQRNYLRIIIIIGKEAN